MGERFVNAGVSEQNIMSMAAAMAHEGLQVICYSIAPFAVFRPVEQIRLDICLHKKNVKIVGNGGGYGYGIMGATHHAIEDIAVLSCLQHMRCYIPFCNEDVEGVLKEMLSHNEPSYLRLGFGALPEGWNLSEFKPIRKLKDGEKLTVVGMGPVLNNIAKALVNPDDAAVFAVSELPLQNLPDELIESLLRTKNLLVVEEHVERGGLGEHLALRLASLGFTYQFTHRFAKGYPNGLYGSQGYHQTQNDLDSSSLSETIKSIIHAK
jgi:transketolase